MTTPKCLGIWMDHASAHLIEFTNNPATAETIDTKFTHDVKEQSLIKSESLMHNKEQHEESVYYKHLGNVIKNYDNVLLFGPTDAKTELLNLLRADRGFEEIKIETAPTDKMTDNQMHAFVKDHFATH